MSFWTTTKTALALVSIGILITPVLRRLGYLSPENDQLPASAETESDALAEAGNGAAPPGLNLQDNGEQSPPRH